MEDHHIKAIQRNISSLLSQTDLNIMVSTLEEKGIFTPHNLDTYRDTSTSEMHRKRCMYNDITRRGPKAFEALLESLQYNGYWELVRMLDPDSNLHTRPSNTTRPTADTESNFHSLRKSKIPKNNNAPTEDVVSVSPIIPANNNEEFPFTVTKSLKFIDEDEHNGRIPQYPTRDKERGVLLLLTYKSFVRDVEPPRAGADVDHDHLKHLFSEMGFRVRGYMDLDEKETRQTLSRMREVLTRGVASVFVVVASHGHERHGNDTEIRCSDGLLIPVRDVIDYFSNKNLPHLVGTPKVFVFQICRGGNIDFVHSAAPALLRQPAERDGHVFSGERAATAAPPLVLSKGAIYTDILIVQSTLPGFASHRDRTLGSWYFQALCQVFAERAHDTDVDTMFSLVDSRLRACFEIQTSSVDRWGFNRRLYLHPGLHR